MDDFLFSLSNTSTSTIQLLPSCQVNAAVLLDLPVDMQTLINSCQSELSLKETNVIAYIGGYVVKKIMEKVCCPCQQKIRSVICTGSSNQVFLAAKAYRDAKVAL